MVVRAENKGKRRRKKQERQRTLQGFKFLQDAVLVAAENVDCSVIKTFFKIFFQEQSSFDINLRKIGFRIFFQNL